MQNDKHKKFSSNSHDQDIHSEAHDRIAKWLYRKLRSDETFLRVALEIPLNQPIQAKEIEWERAIHGQSYGKDFVAGFADLFAYVVTEDKTKESGQNSYARYFEVKSRVNVGQVIRQINYYNASKGYYGSNTKWAVCAPPFDDWDILEQQGILFIPYEPEE